MNASLTNIKITDLEDTLYSYSHVQMLFENSSLLCDGSKFSQCGLYYTGKTVLKLISINSSFISYHINLTVMGIALSLDKSELILTSLTLQTVGFLHIPEIIQINQVTFDDISNTTLLVEGVYFVTQNPVILIRNCVFRKKSIYVMSKRTLLSRQSYFCIKIFETNFTEAINYDQGGAIFISSELPRSNTVIDNCTFSKNKAIGRSNTKSSLGGALYVKGISLHLSRSIFTNNFAYNYGTAIYTTHYASISIDNCTFIHNIEEGDPPLYSLLSLKGPVPLFEGSIKITNSLASYSNYDVDILYMYTGHNINIDIECPNWYKHVFDYSLVEYESTLHKMNGSQMIQVIYSCEPCAEYFYTAFLSTSNIAYRPNRNLTSSSSRENTCLPCPYGAVCTGNNVVPRSNYWGYWHNRSLVFVRCPPKYCCSDVHPKSCNRYDQCAANRTGPLCGSCKNMFSISILTGKCVPDYKCGNIPWFWLIALLGAVAYAMWYTFLGNTFEPFFTLLFVKSCQKMGNGVNRIQQIFEKANETNDTLSKLAVNSNFLFSNEHFIHFDINMAQTNAVSSYPRDSGGKIHLDSSGTSNLEETAGKKPAQVVSKGYFGIFNNFVQMAAAMKIDVKYNLGKENSSVLDSLSEVVKSFVSLQISKMSAVDLCPIVGLIAVSCGYDT